jgi:hypothetical protein
MTKVASNPHFHLGLAVGFCAAMGIVIANRSIAQTTNLSSQDLATTRPLLDQLNRETQSLFKDVAPSIVRVQMPMPTSISLAPNDPLSKWANRLDPESLRRLAALERGPAASFTTAEIRPASPTTAPDTLTQAKHLFVLRLNVNQVVPNAIGVVLDDKNHLLIPRWVDREACLGYPIPVSIGDGRWATAVFVASDEKADLTILRLNTPIKTRAATISGETPAMGTLLLVMSLNAGANRLAVWEGWEPDSSTLVNTDGSIAGFTRNGHFLSAAACWPAVQDLLAHGVVQRATLGVIVDAVSLDDPARQANSALGAEPALRIDAVALGSAAEKAGLQQGDFVLSLAGEPVGDARSFAAAIANRRGKTEILILRNGQKHIVSADLEGEPN